MSLIKLRKFPSKFAKSFYHKWMLDFTKGFSCIYWYDHVFFFFFFSLLMSWITLIDFSNVNHSYITELNPTWSWCDSFYTLLDMIC